MKLELKHLAPYLPYNLKAMVGRIEKDVTLHENYTNNYQVWFMILLGDAQVIAKPMLRPMEHMEREITHKGKTFKPIEELRRMSVTNLYAFADLNEKWHLMLKTKNEGDFFIMHFAALRDILCKWHFDVFGLIEKGLAQPIKTSKAKGG
jgi:hypothetical protein